jgi:hypothetical protein
MEVPLLREREVPHPEVPLLREREVLHPRAVVMMPTEHPREV